MFFPCLDSGCVVKLHENTQEHRLEVKGKLYKRNFWRSLFNLPNSKMFFFPCLENPRLHEVLRGIPRGPGMLCYQQDDQD